MSAAECPFEAEVASAAVLSGWPERAEAHIREHVLTCANCADLVTVVSAIDATRTGMRESFTLPDSGRVWWLAQLRARREAAQVAAQPLLAAHAIAFACAVFIVSSWIGWMVREFGLPSPVHSALAVVGEHDLLAGGMAGLLLLAFAAVYLAIARDPA